MASTEELELVLPGHILCGTLQMPLTYSEQPVPLVLFIAGSGPTDRDSNSRLLHGKNNSIKNAQLLYEANPIAEMVIIEGMNHVLKIAPKGDLTSYVNPDPPVLHIMVEKIIDFINTVSY